MNISFLSCFSLCTVMTLCACQSRSNTKEKEMTDTLATVQQEIIDSEEEGMKYDHGDSLKNIDDLVEWVLKDTSSYTFTESKTPKGVTIATSADKCLRIYSWDTGEGGSMTAWGNIIQYRSGNEVKTVQVSLFGQLHPEEMLDEVDFGSRIDSIFTLPCADGSMLYVAKDHFSVSGNYSTTSLFGMRIKDGDLVSAPCFVRQEERKDMIRFEHTNINWYFSTMGEGWNWLLNYDWGTQDFYVATTVMDCLIDRYDIYHFNGTDLVYQKTDGPYWLYPQLRTYERLELFFKTADYMIRIDQLDEETMRYASWKREKQMSDKPDLVLTGKFIEKDRSFVFPDGSYRYIVTYNDEATLKVLHKGKIILEQVQEEAGQQ